MIPARPVSYLSFDSERCEWTRAGWCRRALRPRAWPRHPRDLPGAQGAVVARWCAVCGCDAATLRPTRERTWPEQGHSAEWPAAVAVV